jgi:hypothetical protein
VAATGLDIRDTVYVAVVRNSGVDQDALEINDKPWTNVKTRSLASNVSESTVPIQGDSWSLNRSETGKRLW